jgi:hypothetical protein
MVLAREDVEVHVDALPTMIEQLQLCEWGNCRLGKLNPCSEIFNISTEYKETASSNYRGIGEGRSRDN